MSYDLTRLASGREWSGYLTLENLDAVTDRIRGMIGDGQPYTWVACNEGLGDYRPEVRTSQVAKRVSVDRRDGCGTITVLDTYGVWAIRADAAAQSETYERQPDFSLAYLRITRSQIQMEHKAPVGARLLWTVAVQDGAS